MSKRIRKSIFLPVAFLIAGAAFYIYYGISYNAWMANLGKFITYIVILAALFWALRAKEKMENSRR